MPNVPASATVGTVLKKDGPNEVKLQKLESGDYQIVIDGAIHTSQSPFPIVQEDSWTKWMRALTVLSSILEVITKRKT
jgi:hypothetical protein